MTYYKCLKDQYRVFLGPGVGCIHTFFKNELVTFSELAKLCRRHDVSIFNMDFFLAFDRVELSKNKTYWMFGARFACEGV